MEAVSKAGHQATEAASRAGEKLAATAEEVASKVVTKAEEFASKAGELGTKVENAVMDRVSYFSLRQETLRAIILPSIIASAAIILAELHSALEARMTPQKKKKDSDELPAHEDRALAHVTAHHTRGALLTLIPSLYTFSLFISPKIAALLGAIWVLTRAIAIFMRWDKDWAMTAFVISRLSEITLLLGSLGGMVRYAVRELFFGPSTSALTGCCNNSACPSPHSPFSLIYSHNSPSSRNIPQALAYRVCNTGTPNSS